MSRANEKRHTHWTLLHFTLTVRSKTTELLTVETGVDRGIPPEN